ncbi:hypothetical protein E4U17_000988 [Claviceps sp. LM77 group G4]|nr:hypothetical protein E4U17_000988 [Claviceps sp. LM77 group G4]KAG6071067.1 hypothetical protein E4U33_003916 [Claviceps sp. LM78 group G4]KAG6083711.1 hypothetical protein E4U16_003577 [Claviceps sp. LM84 group G4]
MTLIVGERDVDGPAQSTFPARRVRLCASSCFRVKTQDVGHDGEDADPTPMQLEIYRQLYKDLSRGHVKDYTTNHPLLSKSLYNHHERGARYELGHHCYDSPTISYVT